MIQDSAQALPRPREQHWEGDFVVLSFDALGALVLGRPRASFEGQLAIAWEGALGGAHGPPYPYDMSCPLSDRFFGIWPPVAGLNVET